MGQKRVYFDDVFGSVDVVISTVQTQNSGYEKAERMTRFTPNEFSVLLIDEAHHATSASYRKIIEYYAQNPRLKIVGVTATPDRADEMAMGKVFESVAFDYEISDAINDGWLVDIKQRIINVEGLDFSAVRTTAGDLNGGDLAALMEAEKNLHGIATPAIEVIAGKRAIAFTASVKQAEMLCEVFNRHRSGMAAWICGKTDKDERRRILKEFASGSIQVVCNCGVLTEGFDDAGIDYIIMARPTKSRALYAQMAGRAIRPHESIAATLNDCEDSQRRKMMIAGSIKPMCEVIDFVGNAGRHKLMTTVDILGGKSDSDVLELAVKKIKKSGSSLCTQEAITEAEEQIRAEKEAKRKNEEARKMRLIAKAKYSTSFVNPFDVFQIKPQSQRAWDNGKSLTEKQAQLLMSQGVNTEGMNYTQSKQVLNEIFRRFRDNECSYKQAIHLRKNGYTGHESREEASKILNALWGRK
jgi:type I site-specific restriction endonuclease